MSMNAKKVRAIVYPIVLVLLVGIWLIRRMSTAPEVTVHIVGEQTVLVNGDSIRVEDLYARLKRIRIDEQTEIMVVSSGDVSMGVVYKVRDLVLGAGGVKIQYRVENQ